MKKANRSKLISSIVKTMDDGRKRFINHADAIRNLQAHALSQNDIITVLKTDLNNQAVTIANLGGQLDETITELNRVAGIRASWHGTLPTTMLNDHEKRLAAIEDRFQVQGKLQPSPLRHVFKNQQGGDGLCAACASPADNTIHIPAPLHQYNAEPDQNLGERCSLCGLGFYSGRHGTIVLNSGIIPSGIHYFIGAFWERCDRCGQAADHDIHIHPDTPDTATTNKEPDTDAE